MTDTNWTIKGREFVHCSCAYGCPCQFNALPTHGSCEAVAVVEIEEGHHGETSLSGLRFAAILAWPGPIHEGRGQVVADHRRARRRGAARCDPADHERARHRPRRDVLAGVLDDL